MLIRLLTETICRLNDKVLVLCIQYAVFRLLGMVLLNIDQPLYSSHVSLYHLPVSMKKIIVRNCIYLSSGTRLSWCEYVCAVALIFNGLVIIIQPPGQGAEDYLH